MLPAVKWMLVALVVFGWTSPIGADEPRISNLVDLREAIAAAAKRGENVTEIRQALDQLEQSLARGWTALKPGEQRPASPELTALRDAVETAARKGENVEEIRKQLEALGKALTGQTFVRPKPMPPAAEPEPPLPRPDRAQGGFGFGGRGGVIINGMPLEGTFTALSVSVINDQFTIKSVQNELKYTITGQLGVKGPEVDKIVIVDGEKTIEATKLKKVPKKYQPAIKKLLKSVRGR
jgi:hypothetical protein